ncbi:MAG: hypothetical protein AB7I27_15115 [Bacteriovoracaceae bacterium]
MRTLSLTFALAVLVSLNSYAVDFKVGDMISCESKDGVVQEMNSDGSAKVKFDREFNKSGLKNKKFQEEITSTDLSKCKLILSDSGDKKVDDIIYCKGYRGVIKHFNANGSADVVFTEKFNSGVKEDNFEIYQTTHSVNHCRRANVVESYKNVKKGDKFTCKNVQGEIIEIDENGDAIFKVIPQVNDGSKIKESSIVTVLVSIDKCSEVEVESDEI